MLDGVYTVKSMQSCRNNVLLDVDAGRRIGRENRPRAPRTEWSIQKDIGRREFKAGPSIAIRSWRNRVRRYEIAECAKNSVW